MYNNHIVAFIGAALAEKEHWVEAFTSTDIKHIRPEGSTFAVDKIYKLVKHEPLDLFETEADRDALIEAIWQYAFEAYGCPF